MRLLGICVAVVGAAAHGDEDLRLRASAERHFPEGYAIHSMHAAGLAGFSIWLVQRRCKEFSCSHGCGVCLVPYTAHSSFPMPRAVFRALRRELCDLSCVSKVSKPWSMACLASGLPLHPPVVMVLQLHRATACKSPEPYRPTERAPKDPGLLVAS